MSLRGDCTGAQHECVLQGLIGGQPSVATRNLKISVDLAHARLAIARPVDDHRRQVALARPKLQGARMNAVLPILSFLEPHERFPCCLWTLPASGGVVCSLANTTDMGPESCCRA